MFGIGGGIITTPALRLVLGVEAIIAVGTPLLVMIPTAVTAAIAYTRRGLSDVRGGIRIGMWGAVSVIAGAWLSDRAGGSIVMLVTAAIILYMAVDMIAHTLRPEGSAPVVSQRYPMRGTALALLGVMTGLYSGFLGLGGGFVLVPVMMRWFGYPIKRAIGTSLIVITILALPGSIAHAWLGHVDMRLALLLMLGVVPGALLGARLTAIASDRAIKIAFAILLLIVGLLLAANEIGIAWPR
jgi:hypothetical protein